MTYRQLNYPLIISSIMRVESGLSEADQGNWPETDRIKSTYDNVISGMIVKLSHRIIAATRITVGPNILEPSSTLTKATARQEMSDAKEVFPTRFRSVLTEAPQ